MSRILRRPRVSASVAEMPDVYTVRDGRLVLRDYVAPQQSKQAGGMSDRGIAEHCGVSHELVGEVRRQLSDSDKCEPKRAKGKDGKSYKQDDNKHSKAGKASAAKKAEAKAAAHGFGATLGARIAAKATR